MADAQGTRYLVVFELNPASPHRLGRDLPNLRAALEKLSTTPIEIAFRSTGGETFAFGIRAKMHPGAVQKALESPAGDYWKARDLHVEPFLTNADGVLVLEVGDQFGAGNGFSRFATWIQRH
jgi:hypothetical protein